MKSIPKNSSLNSKHKLFYATFLNFKAFGLQKIFSENLYYGGPAWNIIKWQLTISGKKEGI